KIMADRALPLLLVVALLALPALLANPAAAAISAPSALYAGNAYLGTTCSRSNLVAIQMLPAFSSCRTACTSIDGLANTSKDSTCSAIPTNPAAYAASYFGSTSFVGVIQYADSSCKSPTGASFFRADGTCYTIGAASSFLASVSTDGTGYLTTFAGPRCLGQQSVMPAFRTTACSNRVGAVVSRYGSIRSAAAAGPKGSRSSSVLFQRAAPSVAGMLLVLAGLLV
ncbi:hypothetical protein DFJ73DRAFT_805829, partial [Zopfochytrium polystomum]